MLERFGSSVSCSEAHYCVLGCDLKYTFRFSFLCYPITCSTRRYDGRARDSVTSSATNVSNSGPTSVASNAHDKAVAVVSADSADDFDSCDPPAAAGRRILVCYYCAALLVSYCYRE